jgi:predicted ATPase/class 3 adenylate cyclase
MVGDPSPETLTFVLTDLESSTRLWEEFPEAMNAAVERHEAILRDAIERSGGRVVKGTGDGLMAVFPLPADGVAACLAAQQGLRHELWGETGPLRVRMGVHAGMAQSRAGDFYGPAVNRTARIMAAAHGGQVLLSEAVAELSTEQLPPESELRDLGEHRLKDLFQPEHIFQFVHPALVSDFPPLQTLSERPNNLPTQTSEFLGREAQLGAIRGLLEATGVRLVTLTGPGGIGKTRLALQAAADEIDLFEDGVYFVDLSQVRHREGFLEAVVRAVGLTSLGEGPLIEALKDQLRSRLMLLVLDNFEQVMVAADDVSELLQQCAALKVLVTSREALRVRGEHVLGVPPLSLPNGSSRTLTADEANEYEAVRLLVERAREARPDFALVDENAGVVAEIAARLDGLPLAIELAAARLTLFSADELRGRLRSRLELLGRGPRDLPDRQRTLRSTIDWSYELLGGDERTMLELLSVFSPTRLEAVERVVEHLRSVCDVDVVDTLASLIDKSLVSSTQESGAQRLSMLGTIREYASERLEQKPDLAAAARGAHAAYFADLARSSSARLRGSERESTLDELEGELGNLLTAWRYWSDAADLEQLEALFDDLWVLYDARGWYHGAVQLTNEALSVLASVPWTPKLARTEIALRTSLARGLLALRGYTEEVEQTYTSALALAKEAGELPRQFPVLRSLATFHLYRGEFAKAALLGRELLELAEQQDDAALEVDGCLVLGSSLAFKGEIAAGVAELERGIALFRPDQQRAAPLRIGPSSGVSSYTTTALLLWLLGHPDRAADRAERAVEIAEQLSHPFTLAYALFHVGFLDLWRREPELARHRARGVVEVAEEQDYPIWRALGMTLGGAADATLGRIDEGLAQIESGIAAYEGLRTPPVFWPLLLFIKAIGRGLGGRPTDGLRLLEEAMGIVGQDHLLYPDFALLRGDLLLGSGDVEGAVPSFLRAFDVAQSLGLRTPELRAATRLSRVGRTDGTELLREVYETFTEGHDAPDLVDARAVLDAMQVSEAPSE